MTYKIQCDYNQTIWVMVAHTFPKELDTEVCCVTGNWLLLPLFDNSVNVLDNYIYNL